MTRRALAVALALAGALACGRPTAPSAPPPPAVPLHIRPAADLLPAAGLVWLVDARLRALAARAELIPALQVLAPQAGLDAFAARHGGVDLRQLDDAVVAGYGDEHLFVGIGPVNPDALERAFTERAKSVDGRGLDRSKTEDGRDRVAITRVWGDVRGERHQLAVFGREGLALEVGHFGVLRVVEAFAQERLKRASPALKAPPLARAAKALGQAPFRAFAPGPFAGEWARGFGGLLATATAAALSLDVVAGSAPAGSARLRLTLVLLDPKNDLPEEATERMSAAYDLVAQSDLGRLCGLDHPLAKPQVAYDPGGVLSLVTDLDALALARGIRAATGARAEEIMSY